MDPAALVTTFNALPSNKLAPSGSVPNHWHFSIRHVPLNPPGYLLYIIQPDSHYVHVEGPMPATASSASTEVKATIYATLLLKAFNSGLGGAPEQGAATLGRPWSWACNDAEVAGAVGETLRGWGVSAPEGVGVAEEAENKIADDEWRRFFGTLHHQVRSVDASFRENGP